jgi:2-oxoglutarate dehydrogenase E2 component (dihydrolipoamide succinyltransferase)
MANSESSDYEIKVPEIGESIVEATISNWLKKEGDTIAIGEPVVQLETAKVNLEVSAAQGGILRKILHRENEDVRVGDILALVSASSTVAPDAASPNNQLQQNMPPSAAKDDGDAELKPKLVTPVAKRMAEEKGLDLTRVEGTGPAGRVGKEDINRYLESAASKTVHEEPASLQNQDKTPVPANMPAGEPPKPPEIIGRAQPPATRQEERIKMSRRRRTIVEHLAQARQNAAMLTTFNEIDMSKVLDLRARRNENFLARYGVKLGITSFFIKASIGALKAYPRLNAEIQGDEIIIKHYYDIGIAVADPDGLVVPVIHDADRLSFIELEQKITDFSQKTQKGKLSLEDLRGGTFTITNGGVFGSMMSTPILTYPQVAILGLHKIEKRPVVINDEIAIRPMMYAALTYDHRIVDGQEAVKFLVQVKTLIEDPESMLLEA